LVGGLPEDVADDEEVEPLVRLDFDLTPAETLALAQFLKRGSIDDYMAWLSTATSLPDARCRQAPCALLQSQQLSLRVPGVVRWWKPFSETNS
jgi:hypothetical protein